MAYVPQIVFAAGLAKKHFICMGDFCQLPAIVQNQSDDRLSKDIFEHVGITSAVNNHIGHEWLVMLDMQYRMHPDIAEFVSSNMYHGRLKTSDRIVESRSEISRVKAVTNLFPGIMDDVGLKSLKGKGFYSDAFLDELIARFNPEEYNPEEAAKIISDEFLQELLERRSSPEFKNIVFSIQKRQGEIIQAPFNRHMVVQGCAGSGKSMIMLHRIPILL